MFFASCIKHASRENILVVLSAVFTLITHFHLVVFTCMFLKRKIHEAFVFPENDEIFSELFTVWRHNYDLRYFPTKKYRTFAETVVNNNKCNFKNFTNTYTHTHAFTSMTAPFGCYFTLCSNCSLDFHQPVQYMRYVRIVALSDQSKLRFPYNNRQPSIFWILISYRSEHCLEDKHSILTITIARNILNSVVKPQKVIRK